MTATPVTLKARTTDWVRVDGALDRAQGRSTARLFYASDGESLSDAAEAALDRLGVPAGRRAGVSVTHNAAAGHRFAGAYRGIPMATEITLTRGGKAWYLTSVRRAFARISVHPEVRYPFANDELAGWAVAAAF